MSSVESSKFESASIAGRVEFKGEDILKENGCWVL